MVHVKRDEKKSWRKNVTTSHTKVASDGWQPAITIVAKLLPRTVTGRKYPTWLQTSFPWYLPTAYYNKIIMADTSTHIRYLMPWHFWDFLKRSKNEHYQIPGNLHLLIANSTQSTTPYLASRSQKQMIPNLMRHSSLSNMPSLRFSVCSSFTNESYSSANFIYIPSSSSETRSWTHPFHDRYLPW